MERNYIIALVLMTIIMGVWILYQSTRDFTPPQEKTGKSEQRQKETSEGKVSKKETDESKEEITEGETAKTEADESIPKKVIQLSKKNIVEIDTNYYNAKFSEKDAIARSWRLEEYERRDKKDKLVNLIPASALNCLSIKFIDSSLQLKALKSHWEANKSEVKLLDKETQTVIFKSQISDNLELLKKFTFYNNSYAVDLDISFYNKSTDRLTTLLSKDESGESGYLLRWGPGMPADTLPGGGKSRRRGGDNGPKAYTIKGKLEEELKEEEKRTPVKWVAFDNKYFMASIIPEPNLEPEYRVESLQDVVEAGEEDIVAETKVASVLIPGFILEPGQTKTNHFRLYVGPKNNDLLKQITVPVTEEPAKLNKVIDFGIFGFLAVIMLRLINIFHKVTANYGISIILLTVATKIVVYPLTRKSFKSMKEMQKLQPRMKELQEKYRDDPKKLNKKIMNLYKEHGVNPFSGCIPWIPQLPLFWALLSTLRNSIELRGATFIPYLASDLSAPADAIFSVVGIPIRILPIINIGAMFLQQQVTGTTATGAGGSQNKFMKYLPLMFVLIFYNWASGFVLYFLCNNILMGLQQYIINRLGDGESEQIEKSKK